MVILIEIVELICQSSTECTTNILYEYRIMKILHELADFLKFLREVTDDYRCDQYRVHRNSFISTIYLLCRLIMFKENRSSTMTSTTAHCLTDVLKRQMLPKKRNIYDPNEFASSFDCSLRSSCREDDTFLTAIDQSNAFVDDQPWTHELELALVDFSLKHFYPDVHELIAITLKVDTDKSREKVKQILQLSQCFRSAVKLLKKEKTMSDEIVLNEGARTVEVLAVIQSDELVRILFDSICR